VSKNAFTCMRQSRKGPACVTQLFGLPILRLASIAKELLVPDLRRLTFLLKLTQGDYEAIDRRSVIQLRCAEQPESGKRVLIPTQIETANDRALGQLSV
jgi:hypothetical protein